MPLRADHARSLVTRAQPTSRLAALRACLAGCVVIAMSGAAVADSDLLSVYRLAQTNDPVWEAAHRALLATEQKLPQARADLLPSLGLNSGYNKTRSDVAFAQDPATARDYPGWNWNLQLTQPLFRAANWAALDQAHAIVELARYQFAQAEQDLILRVAQAYFDILVAQEAVRAGQAQVAAVDLQMNLAQRGFQAGTHAITDVHEARSRLELGRSQYIASQADLDAKVAELSKITAVRLSELKAADGSARHVSPQPDDADSWEMQARESAWAVRQQTATVAIAEQELRKQKAGHLPTLDLTASVGRSFSGSSNSTQLDYSSRVQTRQIGVQLTWPLFAGGGTTARVSEAAESYEKSKSDLETARRQSATTARQAYGLVRSGLAQIEALTLAVAAGRESVKANQAGYRLGTRNNVDVLNAEQLLYTAVRDLAKARYDTLFMSLKLRASTGSLGESDVQAFNAWLYQRAALTTSDSAAASDSSSR